ncbi:helix-turn-helix domain protein [Kordia sp. SMS9]|uniref:helix-turn-helix domain-containing protein n=1 Tax=Kordia sp. SMS9 TaxID=2282170 RepID=UPI000E0D3C75|nr:helix-turn-helix domain-containing protein [Kordia sp. SMS9]AXG68454.1 helix-turn-helix domain protein [Kordia sp. SMS9]
MYRYIFFTYCLFFLCCYCGHAQQDSLQKLTYKDLKSTYWSLRNKNPKKAKRYATAALEKAITEQNDMQKNIAFVFLSDIDNILGNYETALKNIKTVIHYADFKKNETLKIYALKVQSSIYRNIGNYDKALKINIQLNTIAKASNNILLEIDSKHDIGLMKNEIGVYEDAILYFLENLEAINTLPEKKRTSRHTKTIIALAATYVNTDLEKGILYTNKVKEIAEKNNDQITLGYYFMFKGKIVFKQKLYEEALELFNSSENVFRTLAYERNLFTVYRYKAKCHYELQQFEQAISTALKAKKIKDKKQFRHIELLDLHWLLVDSYKKVNLLERAEEHYKIARELSKKNDVTKTNIYTTLKDKYDIENFKSQIKILTSTSKKEQLYRKILFYTGITLFTFLLLFMIRFYQQKKRNKEKFANLLAHIKKLEDDTKKIEVKSAKKDIEQKVPDIKVLQILKALDKFEAKKEYLNPKTSLATVAKKLNTNTKYLSNTINEYKKQTFINYITSLRVNYALQRIKNDKVFRSYSIKGMAEELGFKSQGPFARAFKKQTGIYPSYFIKNIVSNS